MSSKKGILIVISGLSGTGKSYFQKSILENLDGFKGVPKYTTRDMRQGEEETPISFFNVDNKKVRSCTWNYHLNGNEYGIMIDDIEKIIQTGDNAVAIVTSTSTSFKIRQYCVENDISLLKINLQDEEISKDNIKKQLLTKGRTENEASEREGREKWKLWTQFMEEDLCDYTIINSHNPETDEWTMRKEELLTKFRTILEEFLTKQQIQEECITKILPHNGNKNIMRKAYLTQKWLSDNEDGSSGLEKTIKDRFGNKVDTETIKKLKKEYILQRWLDQLWMNPINRKILKAVCESREQIPENHMQIRQELEKQYENKWHELEDPKNELVATCYQGLVNIVPIFDGETVADRIKLLRSPYRDKNSSIYMAEQKLLNRRLIEISCPYEHTI